MITPSRLKALVAEALTDISATRDATQRTQAQLRRLRTGQRDASISQERTDRRLSDMGRQLEAVRQEVVLQHSRTRRELDRVRNALALQHEVVAVNDAAFASYRNAFSGRDVVVVASGPTLRHYEPLPGAIHIGVNSIIGHSLIPLDFYFAHDFGGGGGVPSIVAQFDEGKVPEGCRLFFGLKATVPYGGIEASQSLTARVGATRYFVSPSPSETIHPDIRFHPLADFFTITFAALHFALFTAPRSVHLVGCDASYFGHFDSSPQPESDEQIRTYLNHRLVGYRRMRDFARTFYPETEIVSHNPVNLAGLFTDEVTPGADYRTSVHQSTLARAGFGDEAIAEFVERHIDEVQGRHGAHAAGVADGT